MMKIKNVLQITAMLFGMALLFSYIAWMLGYEGFIIIGYVRLPIWLIQINMLILFTCNMFLLYGYTMNDYTLKPLYFAIPMGILSLLSVNFLAEEYQDRKSVV